MTEENIYEMLGKAGMHVSNDVNHIGRIWCSETWPIDEELFRFAALVAAHEREECAKLCEEKYEFYGYDHVFAAGIRARGKK